MPGVSKVHEVESNITVHMDILGNLKENLGMPLNHMKQQEDEGHSKHRFVEGD
jgi:hypothetical protein